MLILEVILEFELRIYVSILTKHFLQLQTFETYFYENCNWPPTKQTKIFNTAKRDWSKWTIRKISPSWRDLPYLYPLEILHLTLRSSAAMTQFSMQPTRFAGSILEFVFFCNFSTEWYQFILLFSLSKIVPIQTGSACSSSVYNETGGKNNKEVEIANLKKRRSDDSSAKMALRMSFSEDVTFLN